MQNINFSEAFYIIRRLKSYTYHRHTSTIIYFQLRMYDFVCCSFHCTTITHCPNYKIKKKEKKRTTLIVCTFPNGHWKYVRRLMNTQLRKKKKTTKKAFIGWNFSMRTEYECDAAASGTRDEFLHAYKSLFDHFKWISFMPIQHFLDKIHHYRCTVNWLLCGKEMSDRRTTNQINVIENWFYQGLWKTNLSAKTQTVLFVRSLRSRESASPLIRVLTNLTQVPTLFGSSRCTCSPT